MTVILVGWKEIAAYLRVSEKTAIRYLKDKDLPVQRDPAGHPVIDKNRADSWRLQVRSS